MGCAATMSAVPDADAWDRQPPVPINDERLCANLVPPTVRKSVPPEYSTALRRSGVEGNVLLTVVVNANGDASIAKVASAPSPELARSCVNAVLAQLYSPAACDGEPVSVSWQVSCRFRIHPS